MTGITKPEVSIEPILKMIQDYRVSHILVTAVEKEFFTRLTEPKDAATLAREIGTDPRTTERFLKVLVSLRLLVESDNEYVNTPDAETFLVEGNPHYIGNLVKITVGSNLLLSYLDEALIGDNSFQEDLQGYTFDELQLLGHAEGALCYGLPPILETLKDFPEFTGASKVLDLGGGHGAYSMAFAQRNPASEVTLFDRPYVLDNARKFIAGYGMEDRIKLMPGDFHNDDIGSGYDMVFVSHVFYQKNGIESVIGKIYNSLNDNGIIVLKHWVINEARTAPWISVLFDLYISIRDRDRHVYTVSEYSHLLKETGFSRIRVFDVQTSSNPAMLVIGKKGV